MGKWRAVCGKTNAYTSNSTVSCATRESSSFVFYRLPASSSSSTFRVEELLDGLDGREWSIELLVI